MAFTAKDWKKRIQSRSDITQMVTHLTKPAPDINIKNMSFEEINLKAVDTLLDILNAKLLKGSTNKGFINGNTPAVCLQDAPLSGLIQNILHEEQRRQNNPNERLRYCGVGLSFLKPFIYKKEGRPVIYDDSSTAKKYLNANDYWRIVDFDLSDSKNLTDWTHEREWRVPNELAFDYKNVHVILYDPQCFRYFIKKCPPTIQHQIGGITTLKIVAI